MTMAMRICVGVLGSLHGLAVVAVFGLSALMDGRSDPVEVWSIVLILMADLMSTFSVIADAMADENATGLQLAGAGANVAAGVAFCVIPLMQADPEYAEGLGMLVASGIVVPVLGPLLVNAFSLCGIIFVQRSTGSNASPKKFPSVQTQDSTQQTDRANCGDG